MSKQMAQVLIVSAFLIFISGCNMHPAIRQLGPSLVDGTTQNARVFQMRPDEPPLLAYEPVAGGPAPVLVFSGELIVGAQDLPNTDEFTQEAHEQILNDWNDLSSVVSCWPAD